MAGKLFWWTSSLGVMENASRLEREERHRNDGESICAQGKARCLLEGLEIILIYQPRWNTESLGDQRSVSGSLAPGGTVSRLWLSSRSRLRFWPRENCRPTRNRWKLNVRPREYRHPPRWRTMLVPNFRLVSPLSLSLSLSLTLSIPRVNSKRCGNFAFTSLTLPFRLKPSVKLTTESSKFLFSPCRLCNLKDSSWWRFERANFYFHRDRIR